MMVRKICKKETFRTKINLFEIYIICNDCATHLRAVCSLQAVSYSALS